MPILEKIPNLFDLSDANTLQEIFNNDFPPYKLGIYLIRKDTFGIYKLFDNIEMAKFVIDQDLMDKNKLLKECADALFDA